MLGRHMVRRKARMDRSRNHTEEMFLSTIFADNADVKTTPEVFLAVDDLVVESMDGQTTALLPTCYATGRIPVSHRSIPTKEAVRQFSHLSQVANELPEVREDVPIVLLLGRNCPEILGYTDVRPYPGDGGPCALKTGYGWSLSYCSSNGVSYPCLTRFTLKPPWELATTRPRLYLHLSSYIK